MKNRRAIPKDLKDYCISFGVDFVGFEGVPIGGHYGSEFEGGGAPIGSVVRFVYVCKKCATSFSIPLDLARVPTSPPVIGPPLCPEHCNEQKKKTVPRRRREEWAPKRGGGRR